VRFAYPTLQLLERIEPKAFLPPIRRGECPNLGRLFSGYRLHYKTMTRKKNKQALNRSCEQTPSTCRNRRSEFPGRAAAGGIEAKTV
jgi:hypothetical protein